MQAQCKIVVLGFQTSFDRLGLNQQTPVRHGGVTLLLKSIDEFSRPKSAEIMPTLLEDLIAQNPTLIVICWPLFENESRLDDGRGLKTLLGELKLFEPRTAVLLTADNDIEQDVINHLIKDAGPTVQSFDKKGLISTLWRSEIDQNKNNLHFLLWSRFFLLLSRTNSSKTPTTNSTFLMALLLGAIVAVCFLFLRQNQYAFQMDIDSSSSSWIDRTANCQGRLTNSELNLKECLTNLTFTTNDLNKTKAQLDHLSRVETDLTLCHEKKAKLLEVAERQAQLLRIYQRTDSNTVKESEDDHFSQSNDLTSKTNSEVQFSDDQESQPANNDHNHELSREPLKAL